ncbi:MAG TPA: hypothetical protein VMX94_06410 [Armatimonadota bacterium]|nr:hypothetical protein [Armatimonadota bacterium]
MPSYAYRGLDNVGKQVAGQLTAEDERTALTTTAFWCIDVGEQG